ncbi:IS1380 family transposase [Nocardia sp. NBC_00565]|uniref:IS1380 family transposase n=1 Tax=Nocardia sp. NBC_00565 TaxID=2975993 RepID=UPI002E80F23E|nr:IS1380 family transposase [Nocardia sp. NBC_00565]WUC07522.1 IS1380 family transposase [Nocardia sp. NBC_00565]
MRLLHSPTRSSVRFDETNLVSQAGLVPVMRLAETAGLGEWVRVPGPVGANAAAKIGALVAGMVAGADSIDDMNILRHGGMRLVFNGIRAPSTLGSFLRGFDHGNVRQLAAVHRRLLAELAARTPLLPGAEQVAFLDIDSVQRRVFGYDKQGAAFGFTKVASKPVMVRGLNALVTTISTPIAAPVVAAASLRAGNTASCHGAAYEIAEAASAARAAAASGIILARADSAFYTAKFVAACRRAGIHFSVTTGSDPKIKAASAEIAETAWTTIAYPNAIFDEELGEWISDAEIAEIGYTAFASKKPHRTDGRLIVRRVRRLQPARDGQGELFPTWRYHAVFTDSPFTLTQAESQHRGHAIIEQHFADLIDGPLAHLPSGMFNANAAWLQLAATAHLLTRAIGTLASPRHALARNHTIRTELITVAARIARHGRGHITWHLPAHWPWETAWHNTFQTTHALPALPAA